MTGNRRHRQLVLAIEFFSKSGRSGGRAKALDGLGWVAAAILLAGALFTVARLP